MSVTQYCFTSWLTSKTEKPVPTSQIKARWYGSFSPLFEALFADPARYEQCVQSRAEEWRGQLRKYGLCCRVSNRYHHKNEDGANISILKKIENETARHKKHKIGEIIKASLRMLFYLSFYGWSGIPFLDTLFCPFVIVIPLKMFKS